MPAIDDVFEYVSDEWMGSRMIAHRVRMWAHTTVKHALDELVAEGHVERRETPIPSGIKHEYRRLGLRPDVPT